MGRQCYLGTYHIDEQQKHAESMDVDEESDENLKFMHMR